MVVLLPLSLVGAWHLRKERIVQLGFLAWAMIFVVFGLIFPYPGARGGFFHSGAALQPLWWALAPVGLATFITWGERRRGWKSSQARIVLGVGLIGLAALYSILVAWPKVLGDQASMPVWGQSVARFVRLESQLETLGISNEAVGMVNNPPGYYIATGRMAIVIPNGDIGELLAVARRYQASYLLLDENYPQRLVELYDHPVDFPGLEHLGSVSGIHVFRIDIKK
jgi:hypothetical protein